VVGVAVRVLLAFKFDALWSRGILRRNVEVKLIPQIAHRILHGSLLDEVVAARIRWAAGDPKVSRAAAQTGGRDSLIKSIARSGSTAAIIAASTASLPSALILNVGHDGRSGWRCRGIAVVAGSWRNWRRSWSRSS